MSYTLTIHTVPPLQWAEPAVIGLGAEQSSINGEMPNMTVTVDNAQGQNTVPVVASGILRVRAELHDGSRVVFQGAVQACTIGSTITIELEA